MSEDSHGLQCKGRLINLETESGKRIYGAMKKRALDGLSIGYTVGEFTRGTKPNEPRRTIKTIKSLPEASLVTFPMNELARTGAVKAADIRTVRDFEDALRDVLGFSHAAAKSIAQRGFKVTNEQPSRLDGFIASLRDVFAGKSRTNAQISDCGTTFASKRSRAWSGHWPALTKEIR
jgi:hypothetical protein